MSAGIWPTAVPLSRYAEIVGVRDLHWWGVRKGAHVDPKYFYFGSEHRSSIRRALDSATSLMEGRMRVRLYPRWLSGLEIEWGGKAVANRRWGNPGWAIPRDWGNPAKLNWARFIEAGQRAFSVYDATATVVLGDPTCTCTVAHGGVGAKGEVRVYWADEDYSLDSSGDYAYGPEPSKVEFGDTNIVLTFPRERLVKPAYQSKYYENHPVAYETDDNFVETLLVGRRYNDPSVNAVVRVYRTCSTSCTETTQTACIIPRNRTLGWVSIYPAGYTDEQWVRSHCFIGIPDVAWIYFKSGLTRLPYELEDSIVRLAHTLVPASPCGSEPDPVHRAWLRDQQEDKAITRERVNCRWGSKDGAWWAWNVAMDSEYNYGSGGLHT